MNGRNRTFVSAVGIAAVLTLFVSLPFAPAEAQQAARVVLTDYKLQTIDERETKEPLMAGSSYRVRFTLQIPKGVRDTITFRTELKRIGTDAYWSLPTYKTINPETVVATRAQISFSPDFDSEAKLEFALKGQIPEDVTAVRDVDKKIIPGIHLNKTIKLVILSSESGTIRDERAVQAIDKSIETYQNTLAAKREVVEGQQGEPEFVKLIAALVKEAQAMANAGYTDNATSLLKAIPDRGWPQPPTSNTLLYGILGGVAIVALLGFVMMFQSRAAVSSTRSVIDEQVGKLDVVSVKIGRLGDKVLVQEINNIKEELDRISR